MTNCNYTNLSNKQILDEIKQLNVPIRKLQTYLRKNNKELLQEIISRTNFLIPNKGMKAVQMSARLYSLEHNLQEHPICKNPNCIEHNHVEWIGRSKLRFQSYCSKKCQYEDPNFWEKIKNTNLQVRGVPYTWLSEDVKNKSKQTNMKNLGVEYVFQSDKFKQEFMNTMETKYGGVGLKSPQIMNKFKTTMKKTYGCEFTLQSNELFEKVKQTNIERYGVDNPSKSDKIIEKIEKSMIEHHGVKHYAQSSEFHKKSHKPYTNPKYPDMTFGSSWEFKVYDFLIENHIEFEYQPQISFEYEYDGKIHTYHPDFKVGDKIYEVKGDNFFRINESGDEEMYLPWKHPEWTEERYEFECGLYEAKHQCMLNNNIIILREKHINNLCTDNFI